MWEGRKRQLGSLGSPRAKLYTQFSPLAIFHHVLQSGNNSSEMFQYQGILNPMQFSFIFSTELQILARPISQCAKKRKKGEREKTREREEGREGGGPWRLF